MPLTHLHPLKTERLADADSWQCDGCKHIHPVAHQG
jgi:hypothetical protein